MNASEPDILRQAIARVEARAKEIGALMDQQPPGAPFTDQIKDAILQAGSDAELLLIGSDAARRERAGVSSPDHPLQEIHESLSHIAASAYGMGGMLAAASASRHRGLELLRPDARLGVCHRLQFVAARIAAASAELQGLLSEPAPAPPKGPGANGFCRRGLA